MSIDRAGIGRCRVDTIGSLVRLGLLSTKAPELDSADELKRLRNRHRE
jgi:hypothetical protein